jgi:hypothetical protein
MAVSGARGKTPGEMARASGKTGVVRNENSFSHFLHLLSLAIKTRRKEQLRKLKEKPPPSNRRQLEGGKTESVRQSYCDSNPREA